MTILSLVLIVTVLAFLLVALMAAALSRHKKSAMRPLNLIGEIGFIEFKLDSGLRWRGHSSRARATVPR